VTLLGLAPWTIAKRTTEKVEAEYNRDKYRQCSDEYDRLASSEPPTFETIKGYETGWSSRELIAVSMANDLYLAPPKLVFEQYYRVITGVLLAVTRGCGSVVELGCGYGFNLHRIRLAAAIDRSSTSPVSYIGGEYSSTAVHLGNRLAKGIDRFLLRSFDYYDPDSYDRLLANAPPPVVVFTVHSVEQLPTASSVFANLRRFKDRISTVVHVEPVVELNGEGLLDLFRRRYAEVNDYNRDLLHLIQLQRDLRFEILGTNVIGVNPLNPTSIIRWSYDDQ